MEEGVAI